MLSHLPGLACLCMFIWKIFISPRWDPGVTVKMHSPKKIIPSTYFGGNKYSLVYISQVKITPGITFFLGNNYTFGKKSTPLHGHNFLHIIFSHGLERVFQYLSRATRETVHSIVTFPNRIFLTRVFVTRVRLFKQLLIVNRRIFSMNNHFTRYNKKT